MKDTAKLIGGGLVVLAIVTALAFYFGAIRLPLMNLETNVTRASNQYLTTQQQNLAESATEYLRLERQPGTEAQREALRAQMKRAALTLQPGQVPAEAAAIIEGATP